MRVRVAEPPSLRVLTDLGTGMQLFSDLSNKVALVTGASSGLGRHFANTLAKHGVKVGLGARRIGALQALADEIRAGGGSAAARS